MITPLKEPLSIEQVFLHSFTLFKEAWRRVLPITIFLSVIILSPSFWYYNPEEPLLFIGYYIFSTYTFSCILYYMDLMQRNKIVSLNQALLFTVKKLWIVLLVAVIVTLLTFISYVLFIIPGIIVTVWLSMCIPLILLDGAGPIEVLRKSYELTTDEWWRTALVVFLPIALLSLIGLPLQEIFWNKLIDFNAYRIMRSVLFIVICLGYFPWVAALIIVQFEDLKRRQAIRQLSGAPMEFITPPKV